MPFPPPDAADIEAFLTEKRGSHVRLHVPQRGERRELMALAARNAGETLAREQARWLADQGKTLAALEQLAEALGLPGPPMRIECYDISNFQGAESVSMVVFEEGKPGAASTGASGSRASRDRTTSPATRRSSAAGSGSTKTGDEGSDEERRWAMPDIVIVDGGKGQVSAAKEVLDELGAARPAAGRTREGARGAVPARAPGSDPAVADVVRAVPGPAPPRRGAPLRDHLPPRPAREALGAVRVRRSPRRRAEAQARAAQGVRIGEAGPRRAGGADRASCPGSRAPSPSGSRPRSRRRARLGRSGWVPCNIPLRA